MTVPWRSWYDVDTTHTVLDYGWRNDPRRVAEHLDDMHLKGGDPRFLIKGAHLFDQDDNADVFLWLVEQQVLGSLIPSFDQGQVGSCEGHGNGRAAQDTLLIAIADKAPSDDGSPTQWPGIGVCPEIVYANGRDMDGYHSGDGGTGAGTAKGLTNVGIPLRGKYGNYDFTQGWPENTSSERQLASRQVPSDIVAACNQHQIKDAALVQSGADAWTALGFYKPVAISGTIGRTMNRQPGGWCPRQGTWNHCQCLRGRCTVKGGKRAFVYQNSWGDYLGSSNNVVSLESGQQITLPPGCYLAEVSDVEGDLRQGDSFAFSHAHGWPATKLNWLI